MPRLRRAEAGDGPFLEEMLVLAACWRPDVPVLTVEQVMGRPELAHYVEGWPRPGDLGMVAEVDGPVGAAWLRYLTGADPGYGFVDAGVPEVSMAVAGPWRGRGVGTRLLAALVDLAREHEASALSLSVERDNDARHLYERAGFAAVGTAGESVTMRLDI